MTDWRKLLQDAESSEEKNDILNAMRAERQRECDHYDCQPTEWYWSGQIRNMHCNDCGLDEFREEHLATTASEAIQKVISTHQEELKDNITKNNDILNRMSRGVEPGPGSVNRPSTPEDYGMTTQQCQEPDLTGIPRCFGCGSYGTACICRT